MRLIWALWFVGGAADLFIADSGGLSSGPSFGRTEGTARTLKGTASTLVSPAKQLAAENLALKASDRKIRTYISARSQCGGAPPLSSTKFKDSGWNSK